MSTADGTIVGVTKIVDHGDDATHWNVVILGDGYQTADLPTFAADAQQFATTLSTTAPFDTLWAAVNVHAVSVSSTDSGADDPAACGGSGATAKTYFDATFCGDGAIARLLTVNLATAVSVAQAQVPQVNLTFVVVNSTIYGGSGGTIATFSKAPQAQQIALHEMGHTAFGFADEYEYYAGCASGEAGHATYAGAEPAEPNVTANSDRAAIKWASRVAAGTAMPTTVNADCSNCDTQASPVAAGTVGAFTGGRYFHCGIFRPEYNCRMRDLSQVFCAVCSDVITTKLTPYLPVTGITSFSPMTGDPAGGTIVVIQGSGFSGATQVTFGANPAVTFNVDSDTQITAMTPAGIGSVSISVTTPLQPAPFILAAQFTYGVAATAAQVTGISPATGSTAGGDTIVIAGVGFTNAGGVSFGAAIAAAFTVNSDTQITATSPAGGAGTVDVTVTTGAGVSSASANDRFTFAVLPVITSLSPAVGPEAGGTVATISGSGFTGATVVKFGATAAASFTVNSDTEIAATTPAITGTVDVQVTTPAGVSAIAAADQFVFQPAVLPVPVVTGLNPSSGNPAGGDPVTISGSNFTGATSVGFGVTAAPSVTVISDTQINTTSPSGAGTVDVSVISAAGTSGTSAATAFTYAVAIAPPSITSLTPATSDEAGGTSVTIAGTGFAGVTTVSFGANSAVFTLNSATQITATSPPGNGMVDVVVTTPAGTSANGGVAQFTYTAAVVLPLVTGVSPSTGSTAGGDTVVISGSGFTGATGVAFGLTSAPNFIVDADTQITATSASGDGSVDVMVITSGGVSATNAADTFTYK